VTKPNPENCKVLIKACLWLCTASVHNTTQNSSDNLPFNLQTTFIAQMSIGEGGHQLKHSFQQCQDYYSQRTVTYRWHSWQMTCSWAWRGQGRRSSQSRSYQWWRYCHTWGHGGSQEVCDCEGTINLSESVDTSSWGCSGWCVWTALCSCKHNKQLQRHLAICLTLNHAHIQTDTQHCYTSSACSQTATIVYCE